MVLAAYDYITVYDGVNTSATNLGAFCGSSPFTVISTNTDNALHFVFTSDTFVVGSGWEATISAPIIPSTLSNSIGYSFEVNEDGWGDINGIGNSDWIRNRNGTPSSNTGPSYTTDR